MPTNTPSAIALDPLIKALLLYMNEEGKRFK